MIFHCASCGCEVERKRKPPHGEPRCAKCLEDLHRIREFNRWRAHRGTAENPRSKWTLVQASEDWRGCEGNVFHERRLDLLRQKDIFGGCVFRDPRGREIRL